jgi:hypothetical protein
MKNLLMFLAVAALAGCGDNLQPTNGGGDGGHTIDAPPGQPAVPALGTQIDRMGRPAINTALTHGFDGTAAAGIAKNAYNADGSKGGWSQYAPGFAANLAILDSLDTGLGGTFGCGNQALYNNAPGGGGTATATSYIPLATILAQDELNLDTSITTCDIDGSNHSHANYLSVEFAVVTTIPNTTCGGRMPLNDVMSATYTVVAIGASGFSTDGQFTPAIQDGAKAHTDLTADFPFLGPPH